ncbi:MAG: TetR family transcriptional regulator [Deltaproteobacteria bacterium]|nr:MAG: TetR family transcriptional regulator [Deltaproteobacteria bacterium]
MKLREDEREVRKSLIISAAMDLFKQKSFHEVGMRDIAANAGVSAASIYRYFPSRDDLFVEALIRDINRIEQVLEERVKSGDATIEFLARSVVDYFIDHEATFQMMCHFMMRGEENPSALKKFNAVQLYFLRMFDDVVKRLSGPDAKSLHTQAFFASIAGIVMTFRNYPGRSGKERREYMHKLALMIMREGNSLNSL